MGMNSPCINCGAELRVCKECDWYNGVWISKDQYETRLKADMVAMLKNLQSEIEKLPTNRMAITDSSGLICYGYSEYEPTAEDASKVIQQRINELKEDQEGKE